MIKQEFKYNGLEHDVN